MNRPKIFILKIIVWILCGVLLTACLHTETKQTDRYIINEVRVEGIVLNVPDKASLELALLALDEQNRPRELLAVERFKGTGGILSFNLPFDINKAKQFKSIELRGRVSYAGKLKGYLSTWHKQHLYQKDFKGIILEFAN